MNRFRVLVKRIEVYEVTLEAPSAWEASARTDNLAPEQMSKIRDERESTTLCEYGPITVMMATHADRILVFHTPLGRRFSQEDVDDILKLVRLHVGPVLDHWNGLKCTSFSVKTVAAVTDDQEQRVHEALIRRYEVDEG